MSTRSASGRRGGGRGPCSTPPVNCCWSGNTRHGVGEVIWQLPGGLVDPDEGSAGRLRELLEETGYAPVVDDATVRYFGYVWDKLRPRPHRKPRGRRAQCARWQAPAAGRRRVHHAALAGRRG
ncbi:MAG: NUDIX domain-containing protein [Caldilineaceae bacterium]